METVKDKYITILIHTVMRVGSMRCRHSDAGTRSVNIRELLIDDMPQAHSKLVQSSQSYIAALELTVNEAQRSIQNETVLC